MSFFAGMRWDGWELVGLVGEGLFFARMIAQWIASEKVKKPVIPVIYWYMSLAGALILIAYAFHIGSFPVLIPQIVGLAFYARGLSLDFMAKKREIKRQELGIDRNDYLWPSVSVIVPIHNEEKILAQTLQRLIKQKYPENLEIIASLNGCSDGSRRIAEQYPVKIIEDQRSGMSFGKNLGGQAARSEMLVFVDADTYIPPDGIRLLAEAAAGKKRYIGTVAGKPDRGGGVVRVCFWIANRLTRRRQAHAPGGVMFMDKATFFNINGFDQALPQGTSTDCIWRSLADGAEYIYVDSFKATTSIRRFEKTGIIRQMLSWRQNHKKMHHHQHQEVKEKQYDNIR